MRQHLCVQFSCFVLATYFFVKVKGDSYQEWFQQAETINFLHIYRPRGVVPYSELDRTTCNLQQF